MFCPQCGQRQISNDARFCSACGFPLNVVSELLEGGGQLPWRLPAPAAGSISPRNKGLKQGAFLMLSVVVVVPVVIFLGVVMLGFPGELIPLTAIVCVMGGLLRMLYALFFESNVPVEGAAGVQPPYVPPAVPPNYLGMPHRAALPPTQSTPAAPYRRPQRFDTGELAQPPGASVTDHTTRLLDKQPLDKQPDEPPRQ
ncbi:MAG: hypothetical protein QOC99_2752 [Acidobacteriota bacterium]|nr:hypothetical protein [Acidobacteriota bacterium]MDT7780240.1 hypothetical protein [Acidobacteriota bacterium]